MLCGDYGIGFGRVRSTNEELERSTYITVDVMGNENTNDVEKTTTIRLADKYGYAWSINDASAYYNEAGELIFGGHGSNRVNHGDYILWVNAPGTSNNTVGFIVDLSDKHVTSAHGWDNPDFLGNIAARIADEQNTTNNPVVDPTVTIDITGAAATINGTAVVSGVAYPYATGTELTIEVRLDAENDTLTVDGVDVTGQIVDGVYTCTLTITGNNEITIVGSNKTAGNTITFVNDGLTMFNEVALGDMHEGMITGVTAETYSLVKGVDFVDYTNLADPDTGRVVKLQVALDAAFENELEADANGNYTVPVNGADVTIYLNYYLAEDDNANGDPGVTPPGDNNPDDGWNDNEGIGTDTPNPAARLLAKVESANKNIRYWFFVPAGDNEVKVVNADETVKVTVAAHKATDDEIATASDAIKAKIDADNGEHDVWVLTFDTIGTVYETPVTKSRNTATQPPVNELLPYRAAPTGAGGAYEFYGYKDKVVLTEDEAKTALAVALSDDDLKLKASDISIATNGLTAYYTDAKGATKTVALAPKGVDNTYGHWTATKELFAISYKGEVIYYAYDGERSVKFSGMDDGYVAWNDGTVVTTAVLEVADGTTTLSSFNLKKDSALGNVIKVSVSNGRYQYKSEGTWSSDQTDSYVVPGTEIRFWIGASNIDSPIEENGLYRAAINKNTIKTMTGAEVNEATSSGNVMVEIGALTVDMAEKGVADLSIKRVYNVNLNDQPMGAYAEDEAILAGKAGLAKDDVAASETTACINCGRCVSACPEQIIPTRLAKMAGHGDMAGFEKWNGMECIECGSCSYICPAKIPLAQSIRTMKKQILAERRKKK